MKMEEVSHEFYVRLLGLGLITSAFFTFVCIFFKDKTMQIINKIKGITVLKVNTASIDWITDEELIN